MVARGNYSQIFSLSCIPSLPLTIGLCSKFVVVVANTGLILSCFAFPAGALRFTIKITASQADKNFYNDKHD